MLGIVNVEPVKDVYETRLYMPLSSSILIVPDAGVSEGMDVLTTTEVTG